MVARRLDLHDSAHCARQGVAHVRGDACLKKAQALALAAAFTDPDIDVVVYGCTAAGCIAGPAGEAELAAE